jgi:hypothetical protein
MPQLERSRIGEGIVDANQLVQFLQKEFADPRMRRGRGKGRVARGQDEVFAAMPFSPEYNDVFFVAMASACERVNLACRRVDKEEFTGDIVDRIHDMIRNCVGVIADLSESRPNVLYEVGYAHALGKPTVHICSTPLDELPFDVHGWSTVSYAKGQTYELISPLASRLSAAIP